MRRFVLRATGVVAIVGLGACAEKADRQPIDAGPDYGRWRFPDARDLLAPDLVVPGSDRCEGAVPITLVSGKATVTGTTQGAANEFGSGVRCGESTPLAGPQRYYSLSLTAGLGYRIELKPDFDARMYLFSECSLTLVNVDCASGGASGDYSGPIAAKTSGVLQFSAPASGKYLVAVDSLTASQAGSFTLIVEEFAAPAHGACAKAKAIALSGGQASVQDTTLGAQNEFGTQVTCGLSSSLDGPQIYYQVTLSAGTWYQLALAPKFSAALYVASAAAGCKATNIETDCGGLGGTVLPAVPAGGLGATLFSPPTSGSYVVAVDSLGPSAAGAFTLTISGVTPPAGTTCAGAEPLTLVGGVGSTSGDTTGALNDVGALMTCGGTLPLVGPQAYYVVNLQQKSYRLLLKPSFPALLAVGQACASLPADCTSGGASGAALAVASGSVGVLKLTPKTGGKHVVLVDGTTPAAAGKFSLRVEEATTPTNGVCNQPRVLALAASPVDEVGDTGLMSNDLAGVDCGSSAGPWPGPQAYYRVTLQAGTKYTVTLTPEASFDPALYAFPSATSCTAATVDAACQGLASDTVGAGTVETLTLTPTTSGDYTLVVDSWSASEVGTFTLRVSW